MCFNPRIFFEMAEKNNFYKDYYAILGVECDCSDYEIKAAYRTLARKFHPDVNSGNKISEIRFKEIGEAYAVLGNPEKRRKYDLLSGHKKDTGKTARTQASKAYSQQKKETPKSSKAESQQESKKTFNDVLTDFMDGILNKKPKTQQERKQDEKPHDKPAEKPKPQKGDDVTVDITLSAQEALTGCTRKVNIVNTEVCGQCKGKLNPNAPTCPICSDKGEVTIQRQINMKIPSNSKEGSKIRLKGEGNKGQNGGENGDIFLIVHIKKDTILTFDGLNAFCEVPVTPSEAALGAQIEVPTPDGYLNMMIPAETQSGQKFRMKGEGLCDLKSGKKGDLNITVIIEIPKNLTMREQELYQKLAEERKYNPRENIIKR